MATIINAISYGAAFSTTPALLVPAAPMRQSIFFHNPTSGTDMWVYPAVDKNGNAQTLAAAAAGTFWVQSGYGLTFSNQNGNPPGVGAWMVVSTGNGNGTAITS